MIALMWFCLRLFTLPFKSKIRLEVENAILRRQLIVLERKIRGRVRFTNSDRLFFISLYRWFPSMLDALRIVRPETLVRWHRAGFRRYWRCKSRSDGGRPQIDAELRGLIRQISIDNPLWGAPRIHGELLKLGFEVASHKRSRRAMCGRLRGWQEESSLCSVDVPEAALGYRAATPQERTHDD
jgi:hypothetical protein